MPIISSTHTIDAHAQEGAGHYVVERHTDDAGVVHQIGPWLAPAGFDIDARLASRATELAEQLADAEALAVIGAD